MTEACDAVLRAWGMTTEVGFRMAQQWLVAANDLYVGLLDLAPAEDDLDLGPNERLVWLTADRDVAEVVPWGFRHQSSGTPCAAEHFTVQPSTLLAGRRTAVRIRAEVPYAAADGTVHPDGQYRGDLVDAADVAAAATGSTPAKLNRGPILVHVSTGPPPP